MKRASATLKGYQTHHSWIHTQTCFVIISLLCHVRSLLRFRLSLAFAYTHEMKLLRLIDCRDFSRTHEI